MFVQISNEDGTYIQKKVYDDQDLCEFAEWCIVNVQIYDGCYRVGKFVYETIDQVQEIWEIETGRRPKP